MITPLGKTQRRPESRLKHSFRRGWLKPREKYKTPEVGKTRVGKAKLPRRCKILERSYPHRPSSCLSPGEREREHLGKYFLTTLEARVYELVTALHGWFYAKFQVNENGISAEAIRNAFANRLSPSSPPFSLGSVSTLKFFAISLPSGERAA